MSVNRFKPHIFILPEDDANRQLANGFLLDLDFFVQRDVQVLPVAGGWIEVLNSFKSDHIADMHRYPDRLMVLLIDFDDDNGRLNDVKAKIGELIDRVFILGCLSEPEGLKSAGLGSFETIGQAIARDCRDDLNNTWGHALLRHNEAELSRLRERVRPILFKPR